jgi:hypothetical protein
MEAMCKSQTGVRHFQWCGVPSFTGAAISVDDCADSQAGQAKIRVLLMSALWRVSLMLVFNRSRLNREYILINVLKALASIISMCNFHVIFLSKLHQDI